MPIEKLAIENFLELAVQHPVFDVRSPGEYLHAHIPGAINLPLFSNEERKAVGTAYKQQSREQAIKIGLDYFGTKMRAFVETVEAELRERSNQPDGSARTVLVHCWRGGMRSSAIAWLLDLYGFKVYTLAGGYKKYRHWVIEAFSFPHKYVVIGGYTGSGKTLLLEELANAGEQILDLEKIAGHKGSAFGNIGLPPQPSQEMFENSLGTAIRYLLPDKTVWVEDESQRIGLVNLPAAFWTVLRNAPVIFMEQAFDQRLAQICKEYGQLDRERMAAAISRIQKRLGGLETKTALQALEEGDIHTCFRILLQYYDKYYNKALASRIPGQAQLCRYRCTGEDRKQEAAQILQLQKELHELQ